MKSNNTMSGIMHFALHFYVGVLALFWYGKLFLTRIQLPFSGATLGWEASIWTFVVFGALSVIVGAALTYRHWRNATSAILSALFPLSCVSFLSVSRHYPVLTGILFALLVIAVLAVYWAFLSNPIARRGNTARIILRRLRNSTVISGRVASSGLSLCLVALLAMNMFGTGTSVSAHLPPEVQRTGGSDPISANIETFQKLYTSVWDTLTPGERLDVLQCAANADAAYLGTPDAPAVVMDTLSPGTLGTYAEAERTITVSRELVETRGSRACMITLLHEMYHHYQHRLCKILAEMDEQYRDILLFEEARLFDDSFKHYTGDGDMYYTQYVEVTARNYAEVRVEDYFSSVYKDISDRQSDKS